MKCTLIYYNNNEGIFFEYFSCNSPENEKETKKVAE